MIPLHFQHHFVHRRRQVAELALCAQAYAEVARYFPLLIEADTAPYFAIGEEIALGFQAQVTQWVSPQQAGVETGRGGDELTEVVVINLANK